jgi:photosystem II stability/assembly factor-like uncharacterized protein
MGNLGLPCATDGDKFPAADLTADLGLILDVTDGGSKRLDEEGVGKAGIVLAVRSSRDNSFVVGRGAGRALSGGDVV